MSLQTTVKTNLLDTDNDNTFQTLYGKLITDMEAIKTVMKTRLVRSIGTNNVWYQKGTKIERDLSPCKVWIQHLPGPTGKLYKSITCHKDQNNTFPNMECATIKTVRQHAGKQFYAGISCELRFKYSSRDQNKNRFKVIQ